MKSPSRLVCRCCFLLGILLAACNRGQQPLLGSADGTSDVVVQDKQARDREAADQTIDAETVAAYQQLGATFGGLRAANEGFGLNFREGPPVEHELPGFVLHTDLQAPPPNVAVPFFLCLHRPSDASLKKLAGLKNLVTLCWQSGSITAAGLKELARLPNLRSLYVGETPLTPEHLRALVEVKQLTELDLEATGITDAGLKELAGHSGLTRLALHRPFLQITDAGLKDLAGMKNLTALGLRLYGGRITDAGLKELARLSKLSSLNLTGAALKDTGLKSWRDSRISASLT
jgi:hypothetical protein